MSPGTSSDVFSHISAVSLNFMKRHPPPPDHLQNSFPPRKSPVPDLILPDPQPLRLDLEFGLDHCVSERISSVYLRAALLLKAEYEKQFRRAILHDSFPDTARLQPSLFSTSVSSYTQRLRVWEEQIKTCTVKTLHLRQKSGNAKAHVHPRRSFSQHTVSILEKFFTGNAFPSRLEKQNLAAESNLTFPQIHIWFQNRRRRFRKDGKELKRGDPALVLPSELETSVAALLAVTTPDANLSKNRANSSNARASMINPEAPPHAFPSAYPPACSYDPFPVEVGLRTFNTAWMRKPSSTLTRYSRLIDVAQLTTSFMKLTLIDDSQATASSQSRSTIGDRLSGVLGFTTTVLRAPHPALIHPVPIPGSQTVQLICAKADQKTHVSATPSSRKKVAPLPKRIPTSASVAHHDISSLVSQVSTAPCTSTSKPLSTAFSVPTKPIPSSRASGCSTQTTRDVLSISPAPQQTLSRRKVAALPKRASTRSAPDSPVLSPRFVRTSPRTPSASSSTSSGSGSPSGPDTPLSTPPSFPTFLPPSNASTLHKWVPTSLFSESTMYDSIEGLQLRLQPRVLITSDTSS